MSSQHKGIVTQIIGPVLDIRFAEGELPELRNAITIQHGEQVITAEVAQHIGDNVVRCIAMNSTDGLVRGMEAIDTGAPISVPVGEEKYTGEATIMPSAWRNISAARLTQSSITHLWSVRQAKYPRQPGTTSAPMCSSSDSAPPSVSPCPTSRSASAVLPFLWGLPLIITTFIKKQPP